jgi:formylglycine-generating enzyme required for sulfatase activity
MKLVIVPPGEFLMGSSDAERGKLLDESRAKNQGPGEAFIQSEGPQHRVKITRPFYLGMYEVTRNQYRQFVDATGHESTDGVNGKRGGFNRSAGRIEQGPEYAWQNPGFVQSDTHPVVNVGWEDAVAFCRWLSEKEGKVYRLPTEAEWEYACRAGTTTRWSSGSEGASLQAMGNVADRAFQLECPNDRPADWSAPWDDGFPFTAPVGRFRSNAFGLHDIYGNVQEWCADHFDPEFYEASPIDDPMCDRSPVPARRLVRDGPVRVIRGGGMRDSPLACRSASRFALRETVGDCNCGFRVVCQIDIEPSPAGNIGIRELSHSMIGWDSSRKALVETGFDSFGFAWTITFSSIDKQTMSDPTSIFRGSAYSHWPCRITVF